MANSWRRIGTWVLAVGLLCGCDAPGKPDPADRPLRPGQVTDFSLLFEQNCTGCHGNRGERGPAPPLNDPLFLAIVPEETIVDVVSNGRPGTLMPAFDRAAGGHLTRQQVQIIVEGILYQWKRDTPQTAQPLPEYAAAASAASGDRRAGERVFAVACAGCHGAEGQGGEYDRRRIGAVNDAAFLALISDQALRRIIIAGRPDLGMPDFRGKSGRPDDFSPLTDAQIADLVALLSSWRGEARMASTE